MQHHIVVIEIEPSLPTGLLCWLSRPEFLHLNYCSGAVLWQLVNVATNSDLAFIKRLDLDPYPLNLPEF